MIREIIVLLVAVAGLLALVWFVFEQQPDKVVEDNVVVDDSDKSPEEVVVDDSKSDLIVVATPVSGSVVGNPVTVSGKARGYWFFEGSFPLVVVDWDGKIIGEGYTSATDNWMTEDFVPFTGKITYVLPPETPYKRGTIIFRKDNPSGLPEYDDALEISINFE